MKFDFKQSMTPNTLDLYIYDDVQGDGYDYWSGREFKSETSANYFRDKLAEFPNVTQINLYINSAGGSVKEGYGIYAQMKRHPAHKTVYVDGFCNSIASVIAMAADEIVMHAGSVMGIHNMLDICWGNAKEHRQVADALDSMMEGNRQLYLQRSGGKLTEEKLAELMDAETILTAEECLAYGLCDRIEGQTSDPAAVAQQMQRINASMAAQVKYFTDLRQQFSMAMQAMTPPAPPAHQDPPPAKDTPPAGDPPPQQKTLSTFFDALCKGGKE